MSIASALQSIETVSQTIAFFLTVPILPSDITQIISEIELVKSIVRNLPIASFRKFDLLDRLDQVETILQRTPPDLTTALALLQLIAMKLGNLKCSFRC